MVASVQANLAMNSLFLILKRSYAFVPPKPLPVITVPKYLEASVKSHEARQSSRLEDLYRKRATQGNRKIPVITSIKRPKLNHYYGQMYPRTRRGQESVPLASAGWRRLKYRNDEIVFRPFANNPALRQEAYNKRDADVEFVDIVDEDVCQRLQAMGIKHPTKIQAEAIPTILSGKHVVCSAETGSGKTIAYLAPLFQMLSSTRPVDAGSSSRRSPRAIIVAPSRELAEQIGQVALKLTKQSNVGVATMIGGTPKHLEHTGYDVIITTVGLIEEHHKRSAYLGYLRNLTSFFRRNLRYQISQTHCARRSRHAPRRQLFI